MNHKELAEALQAELIHQAFANGLELDGSLILLVPPNAAGECAVNLPLRISAFENVAHTLRALANEVDNKARRLRGEPEGAS